MKLTAQQRESLIEATLHYQKFVEDAAGYLTSRGINGKIAQYAHLGVVREPLPGHEPYVGRLVIPYVTVSGPVDLRFRALVDDGSPKYLSLPASTPRLYNAVSLADGGEVCAISEGEMDALILHGHLGVPAVGIPGAHVWAKGKHFPRVFAGFRRVLVFADADEAGRELAKSIVRSVPNAVQVHLDEGADVTDVFLAKGADYLRERAGL